LSGALSKSHAGCLRGSHEPKISVTSCRRGLCPSQVAYENMIELITAAKQAFSR